MITRDWVWLITCLRGTEARVRVCVCVGVYGRVSAGLSIHVNTAKTPEGADVCHGEKRRKKKPTHTHKEKGNEMTDVFGKSTFKSSGGFLN